MEISVNVNGIITVETFSFEDAVDMIVEALEKYGIEIMAKFEPAECGKEN